MSIATLPLAVGDTGPAVRDLQRRLTAAGFSCFDPGVAFGPSTQRAVRDFQQSRGIDATGVCDPETWRALVEAGLTLGDRLIYLTSPLLRGDDVADLQLRLGALGFDAGRVDGIFGAMTESAVNSFQQQMGLIADRVVGPDTVTALGRLQPWGGTMTVAGARERDELLNGRRNAVTLRVALAHRGLADPLIGPLGMDLAATGTTVGVVIDSEWSAVASRVNELDVDLCLAATLDDRSRCELEFFEVAGFTSFPGRGLAEHVAAEMPIVPGGWSAAVLTGSRAAILRETRAPTVHVRIGPLDTVVAHHSLVTAALHRVIRAWSLRHDGPADVGEGTSTTS